MASKLSRSTLLAYVLVALIALFVFAFLGGLLVLSIYAFTHASSDPDPAKMIIVGVCCLGSIPTLIWWAWPRRRRIAPGARIEAVAQPELCALVSEVARTMDRPVPAEVRVTVDAGISLLPIRRERILCVGLAMLRILTIEQLRASIAYCLAVAHDRDRRIIDLLQRMQGPVWRAITPEADVGWAADLARKPFAWLARRLVRVTRDISHALVLRADELSASIAGPATAARALRLGEDGMDTFEYYVLHEVKWLAACGVRPPIIEGFVIFRTSATHDRIVGQPRRPGAHDFWKSHPPIEERLMSIALSDAPSAADDGRPAWSLVREPDHLEEAALDGTRAALQRIAWEEVPRYLLAAAKIHVALRGHEIAGLTVDTLPRNLTGSTLAHVSSHVTMAFIELLSNDGFELIALPGHPTTLRRGAWSICPADEVRLFLEGTTDPAAWAELMRMLGLAGRPLGPSPESSPTPPPHPVDRAG